MFIYGIYSKHHEKYVYIGQTIKTIQERYSGHIRATFENRKNKLESPLYNSIRKYGKDNFTVEEIDTATSIEELNEKEQFYIDKYKTFHITNSTGCYNLTMGGGNFVPCELTKHKLSVNLKGIPKSDDHKLKIKESWNKRKNV